VYQDNKSSITLEKKGKAAGSKRTKHIKVRYFFIKDMVHQGEVEIRHCPTKEMWSDILTKPKQGREFFIMRSNLLGCGEGSNGTYVKETKGMEEHQSGMERDGTNMRVKKDTVTRDLNTMRSPQGCVGGKVHSRLVAGKKLRVEETKRIRHSQRLSEPSRRVMLARWGEAKPVSE
jgi:hypothetical protein